MSHVVHVPSQRSRNIIFHTHLFVFLWRVSPGKERTFTFDFSYNSFVARDDPEYASQDTVWDDIGVGVLNNAYDGVWCDDGELY